jgi:hypothetical protein
MGHKLDRRAFAFALLAACGTGPAFAQAARYGRVARRESQYNTIFIDREDTYVSMRFGINDQLFHESRYNTADPLELPFAYTRYMNVALPYAPRLTRILAAAPSRNICIARSTLRRSPASNSIRK